MRAGSPRVSCIQQCVLQLFPKKWSTEMPVAVSILLASYEVSGDTWYECLLRIETKEESLLDHRACGGFGFINCCYIYLGDLGQQKSLGSRCAILLSIGHALRRVLTTQSALSITTYLSPRPSMQTASHIACSGCIPTSYDTILRKYFYCSVASI